MKHERLIALASAHAKLKAASELIRWSPSASIKDEVPQESVDAILKAVEDIQRRVWDALYKGG